MFEFSIECRIDSFPTLSYQMTDIISFSGLFWNLINQVRWLYNQYNFSQKTFALVHPKKKEKRGYRHSGEIIVEQIAIEREYSFLEYIQVSIFVFTFRHHWRLLRNHEFLFQSGRCACARLAQWAQLVFNWIYLRYLARWPIW